VIRRAILAEKGDIMHTYYVEQVAGTWLLKTSSGEPVVSTEDYDAAVAIARSIARSGEALVMVIDQCKKTTTIYSCTDGVERAETLLSAGCAGSAAISVSQADPRQRPSSRAASVGRGISPQQTDDDRNEVR
jgi:hypothetical protein